MTYKFSKRSLNNLVGVHEELVEICYEALKETPVDFGIIDGLRSAQDQWEIYLNGNSKYNGIPVGEKQSRDGEPVQGTGVSFHQYGQAVDIAVFPNGRISWEAEDFIPALEAFRMVAERRKAKLKFGIGWFYGHRYGSIEDGYKDYLRRKGRFVDAFHIEYRGKL